MASQPIVIPDDFAGYSLTQFPVPGHYQPYVANVLIPSGLIGDRVAQLAREVHADYQGRELQLVCVLKGASRVFETLLTQLAALNTAAGPGGSVPLAYDFLQASSYEGTASSGVVKRVGTPGDLADKHVLVVEDIIDTGTTMCALEEEIRQYRPQSLKVLTLLTKRIPGGNGFNPAYAGFNVPDAFLVGYGLDYNGRFRDLEHICVLNEAGRERFK